MLLAAFLHRVYSEASMSLSTVLEYVITVEVGPWRTKPMSSRTPMFAQTGVIVFRSSLLSDDLCTGEVT